MFERNLHIALMMEAISSFEMSVNICQTSQNNIPEDIHHHLKADMGTLTESIQAIAHLNSPFLKNPL
jgi:hypothetical protein